MSRAQQMPHVGSEPAPDGSKRDLTLGRAEPRVTLAVPL